MLSGSPCQNLMLLIFVKRNKQTKKTLCFSSKFPLLKLLIHSSIHTVLISLFHFILYIFLTVTKCPQHVTLFIIYSSPGKKHSSPFSIALIRGTSATASLCPTLSQVSVNKVLLVVTNTQE